MSEYVVLREVRLLDRHQPTGRTQHYFGSEPLPTPVHLKIVKYEDDPGVYLLYLDSYGEELTDTYHDSELGAMDQAQWEFGVLPEEWERPK